MPNSDTHDPPMCGAPGRVPPHPDSCVGTEYGCHPHPTDTSKQLCVHGFDEVMDLREEEAVPYLLESLVRAEEIVRQRWTEFQDGGIEPGSPARVTHPYYDHYHRGEECKKSGPAAGEEALLNEACLFRYVEPVCEKFTGHTGPDEETWCLCIHVDPTLSSPEDGLRTMADIGQTIRQQLGLDKIGLVPFDGKTIRYNAADNTFSIFGRPELVASVHSGRVQTISAPVPLCAVGVPEDQGYDLKIWQR